MDQSKKPGCSSRPSSSLSANSDSDEFIDGKQLALLRLEDNAGSLSSGVDTREPASPREPTHGLHDEGLDELSGLLVDKTEVVPAIRVRYRARQGEQVGIFMELEDVRESGKLRLIGNDKTYQKSTSRPRKDSIPNIKPSVQPNPPLKSETIENDEEDTDVDDYLDCTCRTCKGEEDEDDEDDEDDEFTIVSTALQNDNSQQKRGNSDLGGSQPSAKRRSPVNSGLGRNRRNSDEDSGDGAGDENQQYPYQPPCNGAEGQNSVIPCPYYEHNPQNFVKCKNAHFQTVARMKEHVQREHLKSVQCARCGYRCGDHGQLNKHLRQVTGCERVGSSLQKIPDDIKVPKEDVERAAKLRKTSGGLDLHGSAGKANTWEAVKHILFPKCTENNCQCDNFSSTPLAETPLVDTVSISEVDQPATATNFDDLLGERIAEAVKAVLREHRSSTVPQEQETVQYTPTPSYGRASLPKSGLKNASHANSISTSGFTPSIPPPHTHNIDNTSGYYTNAMANQGSPNLSSGGHSFEENDTPMSDPTIHHPNSFSFDPQNGPFLPIDGTDSFGDILDNLDEINTYRPVGGTSISTRGNAQLYDNYSVPTTAAPSIFNVSPQMVSRTRNNANQMMAAPVAVSAPNTSRVTRGQVPVDKGRRGSSGVLRSNGPQAHPCQPTASAARQNMTWQNTRSSGQFYQGNDGANGQQY